MIKYFFRYVVGWLKVYNLFPRFNFYIPSSNSKFVGVWILGGVGNQLFQFATAYALSREKGYELILDRNFKGYFRDEELSKLGVNFNDWKGGRPSFDKFDLKYSPYKIIIEKDFSFDSSIFEISASCYLYGHWCSPKYFDKYKFEIQELISFEHIQSEYINNLYKNILSENSVSLHLRRGDYNTLEGISSFGLLGIDYYERAKDLVLRSVPNAIFFIFSDDVLIAKELFRHWKDCIFVGPNSTLEDLYLMTLAHNHIIANSTFSWWGAYLSKNSSGIKIAPRHWFTKEATISHKYLLDLFPDDWIQL